MFEKNGIVRFYKFMIICTYLFRLISCVIDEEKKRGGKLRFSATKCLLEVWGGQPIFPRLLALTSHDQLLGFFQSRKLSFQLRLWVFAEHQPATLTCSCKSLFSCLWGLLRTTLPKKVQGNNGADINMQQANSAKAIF